MYIEKPISKFKAILLQLDWFKPYYDSIFDIKFILFTKTIWFYFKIRILSIFEFNIKLNKKTDHHGFDINVDIFGLFFIFNIYDIRHYNDENDI